MGGPPTDSGAQGADTWQLRWTAVTYTNGGLSVILLTPPNHFESRKLDRQGSLYARVPTSDVDVIPPVPTLEGPVSDPPADTGPLFPHRRHSTKLRILTFVKLVSVRIYPSLTNAAVTRG